MKVCFKEKNSNFNVSVADTFVNFGAVELITINACFLNSNSSYKKPFQLQHTRSKAFDNMYFTKEKGAYLRVL